MTAFVPVAGIGDLPDGTMKEITARGQPVLLARAGDGYYAVQGRCPHLGGSLAKGKLEGTIVTCPRHGSRFDLKDGTVVRWLQGAGLLSSLGGKLKPPVNLQTYEIRTEGDKILVKI